MIKKYRYGMIKIPHPLGKVMKAFSNKMDASANNQNASVKSQDRLKTDCLVDPNFPNIKS